MEKMFKEMILEKYKNGEITKENLYNFIYNVVNVYLVNMRAQETERKAFIEYFDLEDFNLWVTLFETAIHEKLNDIELEANLYGLIETFKQYRRNN